MFFPKRFQDYNLLFLLIFYSFSDIQVVEMFLKAIIVLKQVFPNSHSLTFCLKISCFKRCWHSVSPNI